MLDSALTHTSLAVGERWSSFLCLPVTLGIPTINKEKTINSVSHFSLNVEKSIKRVFKGIYPKKLNCFIYFFLQINYGK